MRCMLTSEKMTNVSMVRLKKGKKRFEVPAYKNTVLSLNPGDERQMLIKIHDIGQQLARWDRD